MRLHYYHKYSTYTILCIAFIFLYFNAIAAFSVSKMLFLSHKSAILIIVYTLAKGVSWNRRKKFIPVLLRLLLSYL